MFGVKPIGGGGMFIVPPAPIGGGGGNDKFSGGNVDDTDAAVDVDDDDVDDDEADIIKSCDGVFAFVFVVDDNDDIGIDGCVGGGICGLFG